jgi:glutaredoxin
MNFFAPLEIGFTIYTKRGCSYCTDVKKLLIDQTNQSSVFASIGKDIAKSKAIQKNLTGDELTREIEKEQLKDAHLAGQNSAEEIDGENEIEYYKNTFGDAS